MPTYTDALRGYAHEIHKRDNFTCRYCGLDGRASFDEYLTFWAEHVQQAAAPAQEAFDVFFFYSDEESPFVMLRLTQASQVGSRIRVVYGHHIYAGVVTDVHWDYDFSYEKAQSGGAVTVVVTVKRSEKVV